MRNASDAHFGLIVAALFIQINMDLVFRCHVLELIAMRLRARSKVFTTSYLTSSALVPFATAVILPRPFVKARQKAKRTGVINNAGTLCYLIPFRYCHVLSASFVGLTVTRPANMIIAPNLDDSISSKMPCSAVVLKHSLSNTCCGSPFAPGMRSTTRLITF